MCVFINILFFLVSQRYDLIGHVQPIKLSPDPILVRIGDKNLTVILDADPVEQIPHSKLIQLLKNIIQKQ